MVAAWYDERLRDTGLGLPKTAEGNTHSYYLYVCRHPRRDHIISALKAREILINISYPWPIHTMRGYQHLNYHEGDLPHTEAAAREIFSLPMFPSLTEEEVDRVCQAVKDALI